MNRPTIAAYFTSRARAQVLAIATVLLSMVNMLEPARGEYSIEFVISPYYPGFVDSWFFGINEQGQSTGYIWHYSQLGPSGVRHYAASPVKYRDGHIDLLSTGPIAGYRSNAGLAINNNGDVLGNVNNQLHLFPANGTRIPVQYPGYDTGAPSGGSGLLNDSGHALINAYELDPIKYTGTSGFAIWSVDGTDLLSVLDPLYPYNPPPDPLDPFSGPSSGAFTFEQTGLNNNKQFAANIYFYEDDPANNYFNYYYEKAYVYNGQDGYALLEPPVPGATIRPVDINDDGVVLGWANDESLVLWESNGSIRAVLPDAGEPLRSSGGFGEASVQRNSLGEIVAITATGGVVLFDPITGAWTNITASISGFDTGSFSTIQGFNSAGQFVGLAGPPNGGGVYAYVVTPIPEPTALILTAAGLLALCFCRNRVRLRVVLAGMAVLVATTNPLGAQLWRTPTDGGTKGVGHSDPLSLTYRGGAQESLTTISLEGRNSYDSLGAPINERFSSDLGSLLGTPGGAVRVVGIGWDTTLSTDGSSWACEASIDFHRRVSLTVGALNCLPVTNASYSSDGIVDLIDLGLDFVIVDGVLGVEWFEWVDQLPQAIDATYHTGALTIEFEGFTIPDPPTAIDLGTIANAGDRVLIDNMGSEFEGMLALYNGIGELIMRGTSGDFGDPFYSSVVGLHNAPPGLYYVGLGSYYTEFDYFWEANTESSFFDGNYVLNYTATQSITGYLPPQSVEWFTFTVNPEPSSALLTLSGLSLLLFRRRLASPV